MYHEQMLVGSSSEYDTLAVEDRKQQPRLHVRRGQEWMS